jgi:small nuclear ribonucleoprotein (snRNP)-like protein
VPDLGPTWCYAVQWAVETADGRTLKGTLNGTLH